MTDFQVSSSFYSSNRDFDWMNKSNGLWDNTNFSVISNPVDINQMKKNMVITNPNQIIQNNSNSNNIIYNQQQQPQQQMNQYQFDSSKVPVSIKNSEFINITNSDNLWNSTSTPGNNSFSKPNLLSQSSNDSFSSSAAPVVSANPLSASTSLLSQLPPKRKGLIKAHSEDSFQPIQQQFLQQLQQQQQDDENNAHSSEAEANDIEEEINGQSRYKTELCRSFAETGVCRYGVKCQFAHGKDELRPVVRHPKYKTETCKTFHSTGSCPYGSRCRFIHISPQSNQVVQTPAVDQNQLEVQLQQQQHLQQQQQQQINMLQQQQQIHHHHATPIMTRQNSSPQLTQQNMQPLLHHITMKMQNSSINPLHSSQPLPKPTITWSNSWSASEESSAPLKTPSKNLGKRLNVFKNICSTNTNTTSGWN